MNSPLLMFGADSIFSADVIETAQRCGYAVTCAVLTGEPEWDLDGLSGVLVDRVEGGLSALPVAVPWVTPGLKWQRVLSARQIGLSIFPVLSDPFASLPRSAELADGVYLNAGATVGAYARLGAFSLLNRNASIGHHSVLGAFSSIGPGATIAARCHIGKGTMIGAGAVVGPGIRIGDNCLIAMGAVVTKDIADRSKVAGNPARVVDSSFAGFKGIAVE